MAKGREARLRNKQKKRNLRRRREKNTNRSLAPLARELTPKLGSKVNYAYELIDDCKFAEAEQLLDSLSKRYPAIVEAQVCLYQSSNNRQRCSQAAKQLVRLTPRDPDALMIYAQESLFCGRLGIALSNYRLFLEHWPDHAKVSKAKTAIELIEPECEEKIQNMGLADAGLELLVMHDEIMECVGNGAFDEGAKKCLDLLKLAPDCTPARNNLALCYFQSGNIEKAVELAEKTYRLAPDNRFAEATLGRLRFLTGQEDEANAIADRILANPPTYQDPLAAVIELLSFLGRDKDVVVLAEAAEERGEMEPRCRAMVLHHMAVAQCRLGDEKAARGSWKKCLKAMPTHPDAKENLRDLDSGQGHAPWADSISKWIPRAFCERMANHGSASGSTARLTLSKSFPSAAALIPALLDRGDPTGREMAMMMASADRSPAMLDALEQFAFGSRGPDAMRLEALNLLGQKSRIDSGPHRFYSRGKWTDVKLFLSEIHYKKRPSSSAWLEELFETGTHALRRGDYSLAEQSFERILDEEPDNPCAAYNLCVVWLHRDGWAGERRARARLIEIQEQFPDYLLASISLAQFAATEGDPDRANQLLKPVLAAKKLHVTEATALFTTQVQNRNRSARF